MLSTHEQTVNHERSYHAPNECGSITRTTTTPARSRTRARPVHRVSLKCAALPADGRFASIPMDPAPRCRRCAYSASLVRTARASTLAFRSRVAPYRLARSTTLRRTTYTLMHQRTSSQRCSRARIAVSYSLPSKACTLSSVRANGRACSGPNQSQKVENDSRVTISTPVELLLAARVTRQALGTSAVASNNRDPRTNHRAQQPDGWMVLLQWATKVLRQSLQEA